jgi:hypothetical protein
MVKRILYLFLFLAVGGCIEPYQFVVRNSEPSLVVEGYISDKSFQETLQFPSDGRYFTIRLTWTSDVTNVRPKPVTDAGVRLLSDDGQRWEYTPENESGIYELRDNDFKAQSGVRYKIQIEIPNDVLYESGWETLPTTSIAPMGAIEHEEVAIQTYKIVLNKQTVVTVKGIQTKIDIPGNHANEPIYYRWKYEPIWKYIAPLSPSVVLPGHTCWVTSPFYLSSYAIQKDVIGGYKKDLFFMETIRNERIFQKFSALVIQQAMSEPYFTFWQEMKELNETGAIFSKPPFNLATNLHSADGARKVSGYFGVVQEQAKRWNFEKDELSYFVENTLKKDCTVPFQDPAPECFNCREYSNGSANEQKPSWWED